MKMNEEQRTAMEETLRLWEYLTKHDVTGNMRDIKTHAAEVVGVEDIEDVKIFFGCPLCARFFAEDCAECPIAIYEGIKRRAACEETPYYDWEDYVFYHAENNKGLARKFLDYLRKVMRACSDDDGGDE